MDLQLSYFDAGSSQVANLGEARGKGLEVDLRWVPTANWDATLGLSLLDTEITDADEMLDLEACEAYCEGNNLPFAPEVSGFGILTYTRPAGSARCSSRPSTCTGPRCSAARTTSRTQPSTPGRKFNLRLGYRSDSSLVGDALARERVRLGVFRARLGKRGRQ